MNVKNVKNLLRNYGIRPYKKLGQNFLINKKVFDKILRAAELSKTDTVLEIGPGIGNLTLKMAEKTGKVVAVEKDRKMCQVLEKALKEQNIKNIKLVNEDILKIEEGLMVKLLNGYDYKIVANLPYYITSPVIRKFLEFKKPPEIMVLMVQKEVSQRISAKPGKMSLLAVSVQFYADVKIISYVSKKSFWPQPKVDSAIIKIIPKKNEIPAELTEKFFKIVKAGFSQPRKQLINNLSKELHASKETIKEWLLKNRIQPNQRAETLSINNWKKLAENYIIKR